MRHSRCKHDPRPLSMRGHHFVSAGVPGRPDLYDGASGKPRRLRQVNAIILHEVWR
jgi:hypothetical protein